MRSSADQGHGAGSDTQLPADAVEGRRNDGHESSGDRIEVKSEWERVSGSRTGACDAQRDPTRDQHDADDGRNALAVSGLNTQLGISDLDALILSMRNGHDQGDDAESNQKYPYVEQQLHIKSSDQNFTRWARFQGRQKMSRSAQYLLQK